MKSMLGAAFQMTGQVCMAIKRIYVRTKRQFLNRSVMLRSPWLLATGWSRPSPWDRCTLHVAKLEALAEATCDTGSGSQVWDVAREADASRG